jgi:hypothetical protein
LILKELIMNLILSLGIFIVFWWALLATIFSYQLHKQNEDYARRLGERLPIKKICEPDYAEQIRNSILIPVNLKSLKFNFNSLRLYKISRFVPLKVNFK